MSELATQGNLQFTVSLLLSSVLAAYALYFSGLISSKGFRRDIAEELQHPPQRYADRYLAMLTKALAILDRGWRSPFSAQALGLSVVIALFYSIGVFVFVWTVGGLGSIGNTMLLADEWDRLQRLLFSSAVMVSAAVVFSAIVYAETIEAFFLRLVRQRRLVFTLLGCALLTAIFITPAFHSHLQMVECFLILGLTVPYVATIIAGYHTPGIVPTLVALSVVGLVPVYVPAFLRDDVPVAVAITTVVGFAAAFFLGAFRRNNAKAVGITGAIGGFLVGYLASHGSRYAAIVSNADLIATLLFLVFLPVINGVFDWLSLAITRLLGQCLLERLRARRLQHFWWLVGGHIFADILAAALLLGGLTVGLVACIQFFNCSALQISTTQPLDLATLIARAKTDPFGRNGLWVTTMLLSTLVPTVAHLICVLIAPLVIVRGNAFREALGRELLAMNPEVSVRPCARAARYLTVRLLLSSAIFLAGCGVGLMGVRYLTSSSNPVGDALQALANGVIRAIEQRYCVASGL